MTNKITNYTYLYKKIISKKFGHWYTINVALGIQRPFLHKLRSLFSMGVIFNYSGMFPLFEYPSPHIIIDFV